MTSPIVLQLVATGGPEVAAAIEADITALRKMGATIDLLNQGSTTTFQKAIQQQIEYSKSVGASTLQLSQLEAMSRKFDQSVTKAAESAGKMDALSPKFRTGANSMSVLALTADGASRSITGMAVAAGTLADAIAAVSGSAVLAAWSAGIGAIVTVAAVLYTLYKNMAEQADKAAEKIGEITLKTQELHALRTDSKAQATELALEATYKRELDAFDTKRAYFILFPELLQIEINKGKALIAQMHEAFQESARQRDVAFEIEATKLRHETILTREITANQTLRGEVDKIAFSYQEQAKALERSQFTHAQIAILQAAEADRAAAAKAAVLSRLADEQQLNAIRSKTLTYVAQHQAIEDSYGEKLAEINAKEEEGLIIAKRAEDTEGARNVVLATALAARTKLTYESQREYIAVHDRIAVETKGMEDSEKYANKELAIRSSIQKQIDAMQKGPGDPKVKNALEKEFLDLQILEIANYEKQNAAKVKLALTDAVVAAHGKPKSEVSLDAFNKEWEAFQKLKTSEAEKEQWLHDKKKALMRGFLDDMISSEEKILSLTVNSKTAQAKAVAQGMKNVLAIEMGAKGVMAMGDSLYWGAEAIAQFGIGNIVSGTAAAAAAIEFAAAAASDFAAAGGGGGGGSSGGGGGGGGGAYRGSSQITATTRSNGPNMPVIKIEFTYTSKDITGAVMKKTAQILTRLDDLQQPIRMGV